ncbi:hypothetical protein ACR77J_07570 [Tissierella praeacuta]|uniref:hypothetical protein n=1 Tax=Tissierella praeacuta TaxID=43131 RepID=UPI003DA60307
MEHFCDDLEFGIGFNSYEFDDVKIMKDGNGCWYIEANEKEHECQPSDTFYI